MGIKGNEALRALAVELEKASRKTGAKIWRDVAGRIMKPRRCMASVNVAKIAKHCKEGESVLVPGKVLGAGSIAFKVDVAALGFSKDGAEKIKSAGGKCMGIPELLKASPRGSGVRIIA